MTARTLWLAACLLAVPLAGCAPVLLGAAAGGAYASFEDRRSAGVQIDDEGIELRVGNRISDRFGDRVHVSVTSFNRSVLLTGEVPDAQAREEVERIARAVPGVQGVANELELAGASSLGARTNDAFITSKVKARFLDARKFNPVHVKVVTEAGVVYLLGVVTEQEANEAAELARTMSGVRKVVKIFEICRSSDEVCRPRPAGEKPKPAA
ncbi:MAG: BON domain-containing protein [Betaproteobacteria bacterium]